MGIWLVVFLLGGWITEPVAAAITPFGGEVLFPPSTQTPKVAPPLLLTLNAIGDQEAVIFQLPQTGSVTKVGFYVNTVTVAGDVDVRLETVDTTTGFPTGTLYSVGANVITNIAAAGWKEVTLGTAASVTRADFVALVFALQNPPGTIFLGDGAYASDALRGFPYQASFNTATLVWAISEASSAQAYLTYSDGSIADFANFPATTTSTTFNAGSAVTERGNIITFPFPVRVTGAMVQVETANADADFTVLLYGIDGTTILGSTTVDASQGCFQNFSRLGFIPFPASIILQGNQAYRVVVKPTTANNITLLDTVVPNAAVMETFFLGSKWVLTEKNGGTWSQTSTVRTNVGLLADALPPFGVGGGGWTP